MIGYVIICGTRMMGDDKRGGIRQRLWVALGAVCGLMALFVIGAVVSLVLARQLRADTDLIIAEKNTGPDHTHPQQKHSHPPQDHTHPPRTPKLVAFSVGSSLDFGTGQSNTKVPWEVILYNTGEFRSDNVFRAPYIGVYAFTFGATAAQNHVVDLTLYRKKEGASKVAVARAVTRELDQSSVSGSVILKLDAKETVSVWIGTSTTQFPIVLSGNTPPTTLFSGELLH